MNSVTPKDLVVVIRAAGERTTTLCREIVSNQVPEATIHLVEEVPFESALRTSYRIGAESTNTWLMTLDADMLLLEGAVTRFYQQALQADNSTFQLQGLIFDKLSRTYRNAGPRLFRTALLSRAIELIPEDKEAIRPEFTTIHRMQLQGYTSIETGEVYAVHDFEQYYADIYRKAFIHAKKHTEWIPDFIATWRSLADVDADYSVALRGIYDGMLSTGKAGIDIRDFQELALKALKDLDLNEKQPIDTNLQSDTTGIYHLVETVLTEAGPVPDSLAVSVTDGQKTGRWTFFKKSIRDNGFIRTLLYAFGSFFTIIGNMIRRLSGLGNNIQV